MTILIAEDEPAIAGILEANLKHNGFATAIVTTGPDALAFFRHSTPTLVLLDVMLPGMSGYEVCREIRRQSAVPIIMVTARISEADRLRGFDIGADDYVCKPFSPREVVARIKSVLRRADTRAAELAEPDHRNPSRVPPVTIDPPTLSASFCGQPLELTATEFHLLSALVRHPGRVFERSELLDLIASQEKKHSTDRAIDSHIKNLRRKLREISPDQVAIESVYGVGYKLTQRPPPPPR